MLLCKMLYNWPTIGKKCLCTVIHSFECYTSYYITHPVGCFLIPGCMTLAAPLLRLPHYECSNMGEQTQLE